MHFVMKISRLKAIFTLGHFEVYLFKILGVICISPQPSGLGIILLCVVSKLMQKKCKIVLQNSKIFCFKNKVVDISHHRYKLNIE
jgi:hypothetical protein